MLFFQVLLLGGYLYAHASSVILPTRGQVWAHVGLLVASLTLLPIAPSADWKPTSSDDPIVSILLLLVAAVGGPYFLLASNGPLMQRWFAQIHPERSPYRLYALSNIGSLLALLSFPFVIEPWFRLQTQVVSWSWAYTAWVGLSVWCAMPLFRFGAVRDAWLLGFL